MASNFATTPSKVMALLAPADREEMIMRLARGGDFRKAAQKLRESPSEAVLEVVIERIDGTLDGMKNSAKEDIPKQAEQDAAMLASLGPWAYGPLARAAASKVLAFPETFARAIDILNGRSNVSSAIHDARVTRDERGLMPIAEARTWLGGRDRFQKGEGEMSGIKQAFTQARRERGPRVRATWPLRRRGARDARRDRNGIAPCSRRNTVATTMTERRASGDVPESRGGAVPSHFAKPDRRANTNRS